MSKSKASIKAKQRVGKVRVGSKLKRQRKKAMADRKRKKVRLANLKKPSKQRQEVMELLSKLGAGSLGVTGTGDDDDDDDETAGGTNATTAPSAEEIASAKPIDDDVELTA
eukprot:TRINITY_DN5999_c2_g1_i6.p2 TRINITY_DN5999_c2_g1~~TRINITY_DN5999_c2_g1_i6.p2  ORF type:complete len:111 (+),score=36.05 TRINITY_DN5999_c2_g1_i6:95-427(+)